MTRESLYHKHIDAGVEMIVDRSVVAKEKGWKKVAQAGNALLGNLGLGRSVFRTCVYQSGVGTSGSDVLQRDDGGIYVFHSVAFVDIYTIPVFLIHVNASDSLITVELRDFVHDIDQVMFRVVNHDLVDKQNRAVSRSLEQLTRRGGHAARINYNMTSLGKASNTPAKPFVKRVKAAAAQRLLRTKIVTMISLPSL